MVHTSRPLLGVRSARRDLLTVPLELADTVVLYTDGLVEDRRLPLDRCIEHLCRLVARHLGPTLVSALLDERSADRSETAVDDDIAVIAATVTSTGSG